MDAKPADIAISTNGGYPLDQNIYQAVKGMTAAEATVKKGGVIIMMAKSNDGHGGDHFYHQMADEPDIEKTLATFLSRGRNETVADQWQTQIFIRILLTNRLTFNANLCQFFYCTFHFFIRILQRATVVYISEAPDEMVRGLHMVPAHSLEEAMKIAEGIVGNPEATVTAIPDGVSVMVIE